MKKASTFQLAMSYVGVFLGAGFVSGQELWQFFACFGLWGLLGFALSAVLFFLVDYALLHLSRTTGTADIGALILPGYHPHLCALIDLMQCLLLLGILVIMIAGASALLAGLTGLPTGVCGGLFALILLPVALLEMRGLVTAFSVLVPITGITAVILGLVIVFRHSFHFAPAAGSTSALLPSWWVSGLTYAAYNLFGTIGVLVPFAAMVPDQKTIRRGLGLGTVFLLTLTFCILAAMIAMPACGTAELPTAELARQLHPFLGLAYNLLMGLGMFSAALASIMALLNQAGFHWPVLQTRRPFFLVLLLLLGFGLSLLGFSDLIGIVYPVFGYLGIPFLLLLLRNFWKTRKSAP